MTDGGRATPKGERWTEGVIVWLVALLLLGALFGQAVLSAPMTSPSFDEPYDVARGYAYARGTDLRMQQEHPILIDGLGGMMLLLMPELTPPQEIAGWEDGHLFNFSQNLLWHLGHDVDKMMFLARFPVVCLAVLLGAIVLRWGADAYGPWGGVAALALLTFNPNIVAHARVLSTDLGATCLATLSLYLWWRWARRPTALRLLLLSSALGLALSAKTSNLTVLALVCLLSIIRAWQRRWRWHRPLIAGTVMIIGALTILWSLYRFEVRPIPRLAGDIPLPIASYWDALAWLQEQMALGRPAFLFGHHTLWGWWYYFPVVFVLKTPTPLLLLLTLSFLLHIARRLKRTPTADYAIWTYPIVYFVLSAFSSLNLGYRHILPTIPLLTVYTARVVRWPPLRQPWRRLGLTILLAWMAVGSLAVFPHHLAYFNELVGGPRQGYRYLVDSNLDWGQGLKHLARYLDQHDIDDIWLAYFGTADPSYYDIAYRPLFVPNSGEVAADFAPINPEPGWYAISATMLQGPFAAEPDLLDWFRRHEPTAQIGYSILLYEVKSSPYPATWLAACYTPERPLDDARMTQWFGLTREAYSDVRRIGFDCGQTWVYPAGDSPGWYLVPGTGHRDDALRARASDCRSHSAQGPPSCRSETIYQVRGVRAMSPFTVYHWSSFGPLYNALQQTSAVGSQVQVGSQPHPPASEELHAVDVPINVGGQVDLWGYGTDSIPDRVRAGETIHVDTIWRVRRPAMKPPLSIFAHLVDQRGTVVAVGDGLGFPAIQWATGDAFAQRNTIAVPPDTTAGPHWISVGIYSLADGTRLPIRSRDETIQAERILLTHIEVHQ